jgi:DNA-binding transcriptional ArsR family regulator
MLDVAVIDIAAAAEASLDPIRSRLLAALAEPQSAATLAARVGLPRQKVNYHLHALEGHGLIELVEERRKGNVMERIMQATAASFVISPAALAEVAPDPERAPNQLSARWMLALGARLIRDLGELISGATRAGKPPPSPSIAALRHRRRPCRVRNRTFAGGRQPGREVPRRRSARGAAAPAGRRPPPERPSPRTQSRRPRGGRHHDHPGVAACLESSRSSTKGKYPARPNRHGRP